MRISASIRGLGRAAIVGAAVLLGAGPASSQVDQYYEQLRANGSVSGSCDSLLSFSGRIQRVFANSRWIGSLDAVTPVDGRRRYYLPDTLDERNGDCPRCCVRTLAGTSTLSFNAKDEFGGLEGTYDYTVGRSDQMEASTALTQRRTTLRVTCPAFTPTTSARGEVSLRVPVEQAGDQCVMRMPKMVFTNAEGTDEYTAKLLTASSFVRVAGDGTERTYKKLP